MFPARHLILLLLVFAAPPTLAIDAEDVGFVHRLLYIEGLSCVEARFIVQRTLGYACPRMPPNLPPNVCEAALVADCEVDADGDGFPAGLDCDDADAAVYPNATEVCDGLDNDCDGSVDNDASCVEDCTDGSDNDSDGLVDCEDGDCATDASCYEDCSDGSDNDLDGLTDCEDDDCWSVASCAHPGGVRSRVHGGGMVQDLVKSTYYWNWNQVSSHFHITSFYDYGATLDSVWGTVRVLPEGASSWGTTSARTTCQWSVAGAYLRFVGEYHWQHNTAYLHYEFHDVVRSGFYVEPGCRLESSWFLPGVVRPVVGGGLIGSHLPMRAYFVGSVPWYQGSLSFSSYDHTSSRWVIESSYSGFNDVYETHHWTIHRESQLNSAGSSYFASP